MLAIVVALFVVISSTSGWQVPVMLPIAARDAITRAQPGWRVSALSEKLTLEFTPSAMSPEPNVLVGDFDGNNETDYAVLVEYGVNPREPHGQLLVVLQAQGVFRAVRVGRVFEPDGTRYLYPRAKGSTLYDLNADKEFVCTVDAIGVHHEEGGCTTFVFKDGKFEGIWTCD